MTKPDNPYRKQLDDVALLWHRRGHAQHIFGIERIVLIALSAAMMTMPTIFIRWIAGLFGGYPGRKIAIELWVLFKPCVLFWILLSGHWIAGWSPYVCTIGLIDMFLYLFSLVLLRGFWPRPPSYSRSLICLGINLFEFTAAFSVLYLHFQLLQSSSGVITDWGSAFYFSMVTTATIGYGDISPTQGFGRGLVTAQIVLSIAYMAIIISRFVANIDTGRTPIKHA